MMAESRILINQPIAKRKNGLCIGTEAVLLWDLGSLLHTPVVACLWRVTTINRASGPFVEVYQILASTRFTSCERAGGPIDKGHSPQASDNVSKPATYLAYLPFRSNRVVDHHFFPEGGVVIPEIIVDRVFLVDFFVGGAVEQA